MIEVMKTLTELDDDDRVRIIEQRIPPGGSTGFHRHEYDYVVVPTSNGELISRGKDGDRIAKLELGVPRINRAGIEHEVVNEGDSTVTSIEIELKY